MGKKVSIVIPTYNRKDLLSGCLESIGKLSYSDYEVIVVDDASEDGTTGHLALNFSGVRLIRNDVRKGPAYCKNQGILKSSGEFIWFLDSDSVVLNYDCLSNMVNILAREENVGCLGGELLFEGGSYFARIDEEYRSRKVPVEGNGKNSFNMLKVRSLMSCNLISRKEILLKLGGFDTNYFYISEDTDICERCSALGYDVILDYSVWVLHKYSAVARKSNYYLLFRNELRCAVKNRGVLKGFLREPLRLFRNIFQAAGRHSLSDTGSSGTINIITLSKINKALGMLRLGFSMCFGFAGAYLWNIFFAYKTINIDKKTNYLESTKI